VEGSGFMSGEEPIGAQAQDPETEAGSPPANRPDRIRSWFAALGRALTALVITLVVLGLLGGVTDVVLHEVRHTDTGTSSYQDIDAVVVVLDGDVSLNVVGNASGSTATLTTADTSTTFDDPVRTVDLIGATLYLTERCPDSQCSAQLNLTVQPSTDVSVVAGNALRLDDAVIDIDGITGQASIIASPAKVFIASTVASGAVLGTLSCDSNADCANVATVKSSS
jgi:hypothetical protein